MNKLYTVGFVVSVISIALTYIYFDIPVALWAFSQEGSFIYTSAKLIGHGAESQYWLIVAALIGLYFHFVKPNKDIMIRARFLFASIIASGVGVLVLKVFFGKPRPYVYKNSEEFGFTFFNTNYDYFSFPSGHTTTAFSVVVALSLMFPRFTPLFLTYGISMAYSRVAEFMHYPSDVMAGALLGTTVTLFLYHKTKLTFSKNALFKKN
jgi:membrane-associated phospholipid phosphatase